MSLTCKNNFWWLATLFVVGSPIFVQSNDVVKSVESVQNIITAFQNDVDTNAMNNYEAAVNLIEPYVGEAPEVLGLIRDSWSSYVLGIRSINEWCVMAVPELERSKRASDAGEIKGILKDVLPQGVLYADYSKSHLEDSTFSMNLAIVNLDRIKSYLTSVKRNLEIDAQRQIDKIRRNEDMPEFLKKIPLIGGLVAGANQIVNEQLSVYQLKSDLDRKTKIITDIVNDVTSLTRKNLNIKTNLQSAILSASDVRGKTNAASVLLFNDITVKSAVEKLIGMANNYMNKYKPQIDRYNELKKNRPNFHGYYVPN